MGVHVFGDDCRPDLVGVVADQRRVVAQRDLGPTVSELTTFGEDPNGERYAVSRGHWVSTRRRLRSVYRLARLSTAAPRRRVIACGVTDERLPNTLFAVPGMTIA